MPLCADSTHPLLLGPSRTDRALSQRPCLSPPMFTPPKSLGQWQNAAVFIRVRPGVRGQDTLQGDGALLQSYGSRRVCSLHSGIGGARL